MPDIVYAVNDFADIHRRLQELEAERAGRFREPATESVRDGWLVKNFIKEEWYRCDLIRRSLFWHRTDAQAGAHHFVADPHSFWSNSVRMLPTSIGLYARKPYELVLAKVWEYNSMIVFARLIALGVTPRL